MQELAYGLANAIAVLDAVRESGQVPEDEFPEVVGRISFFIDAGVRFVEEMCKMRAFTADVGPHLRASATASTDQKLRRFRYGMQVNSLGLTEEQPENNVQRIVLEMLGVTLSKDARARAIQLPCWNEALGLPTPWDQQWSLRIQQVLAYESDLLEYGDLFEGSKVVEAQGRRAASRPPRPSSQWVLDGGGSFAMIDEMKGRLVQSHAERVRRIESGELAGRRRQRVHRDRAVAARRAARSAAASSTIDPAVEHEHVEAIAAVARRPRRRRGRRRARRSCATVAATDREPHAGDDRRSPRRAGPSASGRGALREVFGEYRAPTGVGAVAVRRRRRDAGGARAGRRTRRASRAARSGSSSASPASTATPTAPSRSRSRPATPGMEVVYQGIRLTPDRDRGRGPGRGRRRRRPLDPVGLAPRAGARDAATRCATPGSTRRSWSAASSPTPTARELEAMGVARVYTPKDFRLAADHGATSPTWPGSAGDQSSGRGGHPPMRTPMEDPRSSSPSRAAWPRSPPARSASPPTRPCSRSSPASAGVIAAIAGVALGARGAPQRGPARRRPRTRSARCAASSRRSTPCLQEESSRRAAEDELGPPPRRGTRSQRARLRPRDRALRRALLRGARAAAGRGGPPFAATGLGRDLRDRQHGRVRRATRGSRRSVSSATSCAARCARATPRAGSAT